MLSLFKYERIADGIRILGSKFELEDVVIPEGVVEIAEDAFADEEIETVNFPNSLLRIADGAFSDCAFLRCVYFPKKCRLREIGDNCFESSIITRLLLPGEIESIGSFAFSSCEYLEEIGLDNPQSIKTVGEGAFEDCSSLSDRNIPEAIKRKMR